MGPPGGPIFGTVFRFIFWSFLYQGCRSATFWFQWPYVKVLFFCSFTKLCMRSQKWDRQAVPFLGPCLGSFFEVFCIKVAEAQRFGFNEALWLMATGRATREALLSEAGFEKAFRTQNWVRRGKLFCRWFCFLLGQAGCISVAAWTQLKLASYYFVSSGGLIVCC